VRLCLAARSVRSHLTILQRILRTLCTYPEPWARGGGLGRVAAPLGVGSQNPAQLDLVSLTGPPELGAAFSGGSLYADKTVDENLIFIPTADLAAVWFDNR
jgi:hypothetical protein